MVTVKIDGTGTLWFFSADSSNKNTEIKINDQVELLYNDLSNSDFLSIHGRAQIIVDPELAKRLWTPDVEAWFENGPEDEDITLIKVTPILGNYRNGKQAQMRAIYKQSLAELEEEPGRPNGKLNVAVSAWRVLLCRAACRCELVKCVPGFSLHVQGKKIPDFPSLSLITRRKCVGTLLE